MSNEPYMTKRDGQWYLWDGCPVPADTFLAHKAELALAVDNLKRDLWAAMPFWIRWLSSRMMGEEEHA